MTKKQFRKKYRELVKNSARMLRIFGEAALESGSLNIEKARDDFGLPKNVVCAALREASHQYRPFQKADEKEIKNILATTYPDYSK